MCREFTVNTVSEWMADAATKTVGAYNLPDSEADLKTGITTTASEQALLCPHRRVCSPDWDQEMEPSAHSRIGCMLVTASSVCACRSPKVTQRFGYSFLFNSGS